MLKVLTWGQEYEEPCALLLGGFDGLHAGHMTLIAAARKTGLPIGVMSISGGKRGGDVFTAKEREYIYDRTGAAFALEIPFTEEIKNMPAEQFTRDLFAKIPAAAVFCGEDFRFGKDALGTPALLKKIAPCPVEVLPLKTANGEKIAVSWIKKLLSEGNLDSVNRLLACDYFLQGVVRHGRQEGRKYGFPTLNLTFPAEKYPLKEGVYAGYAHTPKGEFPAIINFGARPTFELDEKLVEAHLVGFSGDLYGADVRVYFTQFLRPTIKFENAEALKNQLQKDKENLKHVL